jgi:hypothetical protein
MSEPDGTLSRMRRWTRRGPVRVLLSLGVPYLILLAMFTGLQRKLIYIPRKGDVPLAAAGIPVARARLAASTGEALRAPRSAESRTPHD